MHRYFGVDLDILWSVVREDLPVLIDRVGRWFAGGLVEGDWRWGWVVRHRPVGTPDRLSTEGGVRT